MRSRSGPATRLPVTDLFFRSLFAFFIIEQKSRKVIHVGLTRSPTDAWTAQQLREATPYGVGPKYLIRDNDSKFGVGFARVAKTSGFKILKTPYHTPRANAICERFLGSVSRECLDHLLILQEKQRCHTEFCVTVNYRKALKPGLAWFKCILTLRHYTRFGMVSKQLQRVLKVYVGYFNQARPHQGIQQQVPERKAGSVPPHPASGKVIAFPVLGGLHRDYRQSA